MAIHLGGYAAVKRRPAVAVVLILVLLSLFALMLMFEMLVDGDGASDNDCFLDETHCDWRCCWVVVLVIFNGKIWLGLKENLVDVLTLCIDGVSVL